MNINIYYNLLLRLPLQLLYRLSGYNRTINGISSSEYWWRQRSELEFGVGRVPHKLIYPAQIVRPYFYHHLMNTTNMYGKLCRTEQTRGKVIRFLALGIIFAKDDTGSGAIMRVPELCRSLDHDCPILIHQVYHVEEVTEYGYHLSNRLLLITSNDGSQNLYQLLQLESDTLIQLRFYMSFEFKIQLHNIVYHRPDQRLKGDLISTLFGMTTSGSLYQVVVNQPSSKNVISDRKSCSVVNIATMEFTLYRLMDNVTDFCLFRSPTSASDPLLFELYRTDGTTQLGTVVLNYKQPSEITLQASTSDRTVFDREDYRKDIIEAWLADRSPHSIDRDQSMMIDRSQSMMIDYGIDHLFDVYQS